MKMNSEDGKTGSTTTGTAPSLPVRRAKVFQAFLLMLAGEADFVADFGNVRLDPRTGRGRSVSREFEGEFL